MVMKITETRAVRPQYCLEAVMGLPRNERGSGQVRGLTWYVSTGTSYQTVMQLELGMSHQLTAGVHLT